MNIVVVDNSKIVRGRISTLVSTLPDVKVDDFDISEYKYGHFCADSHPNVIIISSEDASIICLNRFQELKKLNPKLLGIVLSNKPYKVNQSKWRDVGAEFYFDKSTEFEKILDVCAVKEKHL